MRIVHFAKQSVVTLAFSCLVLAGCGGDSNEPDAPFDAAGTTEDVESIELAFNADVVQSYAGSSAHIAAAVGSSGAVVTSAPNAAVVSNRSSAVRYAERLGRGFMRPGTRPSFSTASIPQEYLGTTFVWNTDSDQYVVSDRTGAPSNGVRFVLYAVNPATGQPVEPLAEVGYADLTVTETASSYLAHAVVVSGGVTYLDYSVSASGNETSATVSVFGYVSNGVDRANFDLDNHLTSSQNGGVGFSLDYTLEVPTRGGFRIQNEVDIQGLFTETTTTTADLIVRGPHGTVRLAGGDTNGTGTYTISVNGDELATVSVAPNTQPVFTSADGDPLTEEELTAVRAVFAVFAEGFDFFEDLLDPLP